jgi:hypothetical protein
MDGSKIRLLAIPILAALALVASHLATPEATADSQTTTDARGDNTDPDGDATSLDIESLSYGHRNNDWAPAEPRLLTLTLSMYEPWSNDVLIDRKETIGFHLRVNRARCVNRVIILDTNPDGTPFALMLGGCGGPAKFLGYLRMWRADDRTLKLDFPKSMLGRDPRRVAIRALTSNTGGECQRPSGESTEPCEDVVPDDGFLVHKL